MIVLYMTRKSGKDLTITNEVDNKHLCHLTAASCDPEDLHEFISAVYAYQGKESIFTAKYGEYSKILRKFEIMKKLVEKFEESLN